MRTKLQSSEGSRCKLSSRALPLPLVFFFAFFISVAFSDEARVRAAALERLDTSVINTTYLRCAFSAASYLRILNESNQVDPRFDFSERRTTFLIPPLTEAEKARAGHNDCGIEWIEDAALYSGLDSIIFVGDSTIMRDFMYVRKASENEYQQKVRSLDSDFLNATLRLSSGRDLKLHFIRLLYVRACIPLIEYAFRLATRNSMIVFSFGPHDTSWLVFRQPMPGYKKAHVGNWLAAQIWWRRHSTTVMHSIASNLLLFDHIHRRPGEDDPRIPVRPFVVIREHYLPNCRHPKYSKSPHITRCNDLLHPVVVPYYRSFLRGVLGLVNVPTVGIDYLFPTCHLIDAGHLARWCKRFELQLLVQAMRLARRNNIVQGFVSKEAGNFLHLLGDARWEDVAEHLLRHPTEPLVPSSFSKQALLEDPFSLNLLKRWDINGQLELDVEADGFNATANRIALEPKAFVSSNSLLREAADLGIDVHGSLPSSQRSASYPNQAHDSPVEGQVGVLHVDRQEHLGAAQLQRSRHLTIVNVTLFSFVALFLWLYVFHIK